MLLRLFVCLALTGLSAFAQWQRQVDGDGKGGFKDSPPPHPLSYYKVDICLRPESDRAIQEAYECTWPGAPKPSAAELKRRAGASAELVEVGNIGEFTIYDLWYTSGMPTAYRSGGRDIRSVLVKTGPDLYHEIDVHMRRGNVFPASEIVDLDGEPILIVKSHDGGAHTLINNELYMFRPNGPERPNFSAVAEAVKKLTPPNMSPMGATEDFASMTFELHLARDDFDGPRLGMWDGFIKVTYRFVDGRAVVISSKYEPIK